jgi:predicted MFS family arabinose efflux permease
VVHTHDSVLTAEPGRTAGWWRDGYSRLLASQGVSAIGDRTSYVIVPFCLLAVGVSAPGVAIVLGARAVGYALVVLYGGVLADRLSRRRIMVASDLVRLTTQGATAALVFTGHQGLVPFVALQFVFGTAEALFKPAAAGMLPDLVPDARLERANGLLGSTVNVGMVVGPVLGGLLVGSGLAGAGLAMDSATFLASALLLSGLPERRAAPRPRQPIRTDLREGWHVLLGQRWLVMVMIAAALFELLALSAVFSLGPVLADQSLGGAPVWGVLVTAFGLGGIAGGLLATRLSPRRPAVWCAVLLAVLSGQPLVLASGLPVVLIGVLQFGAGVALSCYGAVVGATTQRTIPRAAMSRLSSFDQLATTSLLPLGYVVVGALAGLTSVRLAMWAVALLSGTICLTTLASPGVRSLHRGKEPTDDH